MNRIYLSPPHMTGEEMKYIEEAITSNWVAPVGPHLDAFEKELATVLRVDDTVLLNSGTSAIHLGLLSLGVKSGDEVICPTLTFCAAVNPVIYCGATPVFVDAEEETWNMDPALLEEAITSRIHKTKKKPRAIIVVHLYGMPAKMTQIMRIANQYEIPVLEDAAEALGSLYKGMPAGTIGDVGIISFNGNKIITTSGGGALLSNNKELLRRVRYLREQAKEPLPYYEHKEIGYNYRLSNVSAAIGRAQLKDLAKRVEKRREIFNWYASKLGKKSGVSFQKEPDGHYSNRWLTVLLIEDNKKVTNESIRALMENANIECRLAWKPMHLQPVFKDCIVFGGKISASIFSRGLCLPSGTLLSIEDLERIAKLLDENL
jgi:dTDP-4-amino-4,6-dideoxygalactose transaminase